MEIRHEHGYINLIHPKWNKLAVTEYDEGLFKIISETTWTKNGDYIRSSKLNKSLHQVVMEYWYGEDAVKEAYKNGFVIDHINNNGFDCRICNLNFLHRFRNSAKGLTFDREREASIYTMALNIFKDFKSKRFQITIGFNKPTLYKNDNGDFTDISSMKLLYNDDFRIVFSDAESILYEAIEYGSYDLSKLRFTDIKYEKAFTTILKPEEKDAAVVERDGQYYLVLDGKSWISEVAHDKDWYGKE